MDASEFGKIKKNIKNNNVIMRLKIRPKDEKK